MAKRKSGLGRGLGALLEENEQESDVSFVKEAPIGINTIPVEHIETNPFQPRTEFDEEALNELADSISVHGIIQPITVRQLSRGEYQLISGERRLQASKRIGLSEIPAYVRTADDQQMLEMALIENIQRENLNAIEVALSYQRLMSECELKQEELGERVGKKRTTINNYLRLLRLPTEIQAGLRDQRLSMGHARALVNIEEIDKQLAIYDKVVEQDLSVRKTEELVRELGRIPPSSIKPVNSSSPEILKLQVQLSSHFGTKIKISANADNKGDIKIPFESTEDLNRLLEILDI